MAIIKSKVCVGFRLHETIDGVDYGSVTADACDGNGTVRYRHDGPFASIAAFAAETKRGFDPANGWEMVGKAVASSARKGR